MPRSLLSGAASAMELPGASPVTKNGVWQCRGDAVYTWGNLRVWPVILPIVNGSGFVELPVGSFLVIDLYRRSL